MGNVSAGWKNIFYRSFIICRMHKSSCDCVSFPLINTQSLSKKKNINDECMNNSREILIALLWYFFSYSTAIKMYTKLAAHEHMRAGLPFSIFILYFSLDISPLLISQTFRVLKSNYFASSLRYICVRSYILCVELAENKKNLNILLLRF